MSMGVILREKRKLLGLTQEQVANLLGVSPPAVNKWEKGTTCPDMGLLPAVARVLKTDPNTLLGFQESLSKEEIWGFLGQVTRRIQGEGVDCGFSLVAEKTREYPGCAELLHAAALTLDGALMLSALTAEERRTYQSEIQDLYERVAESGDSALATQARYLLVSKRIEAGENDGAQELLDLLPEWSSLDKRGMQAELWSRQGELEKAAALLERKLMLSVQDNQTTLCRLIRLAVQEGDEAGALALADCARGECESFSLGAYWSHIAPLEVAVARRDISGSLEALDAILGAVDALGELVYSPLFCHLPVQKAPSNLGTQVLKPLLCSLEHGEEYAFLREVPEFQALMGRHWARCGGEG